MKGIVILFSQKCFYELLATWPIREFIYWVIEYYKKRTRFFMFCVFSESKTKYKNIGDTLFRKKRQVTTTPKCAIHFTFSITFYKTKIGSSTGTHNTFKTVIITGFQSHQTCDLSSISFIDGHERCKCCYHCFEDRSIYSSTTAMSVIQNMCLWWSTDWFLIYG